MNEKKNIEEHLSDVKHDLRSELSVIIEMTKLVLDGLGNSECAKCYEFLRPALESANKINKLIEQIKVQEEKQGCR